MCDEELKAKHRRWIRNQVEDLGCDEVFDEERDGTPLCPGCGCAGGMECGHDPLNSIHGCSLHHNTLYCYCCAVDGMKAATDAEVDAAAGQLSLLEGEDEH